MTNEQRVNPVIEFCGFQDLLEVLDDFNGNISEAAEYFYSSEWNYNNADTTSGMQCFTYDEIFDAMIDVKSELDYLWGPKEVVYSSLQADFDEEKRHEEPVLYE